MATNGTAPPAANIGTATTKTGLETRLAQRFAPQPFAVPDFDITVETRPLKALEQDELVRMQEADKSLSVAAYDAKRVSLGMTAPTLTYEEALELPPEFLSPISQRIGEQTYGYLRSKEAATKAGERVPFRPLSGGSTGAS